MNKLLSLLILLNVLQSCTSHQESRSDKLQLNHGKKWSVNEEMKPHISDGEILLKSYIDSKNKDYKTLAIQLRETNNSLIQSCTMKGESHDELHKWLHPHIELINDLETAPDEMAAALILRRLQKSFETYKEYFQ